MGYRVTVFEAMEHGGGMMRYGIPDQRRPRTGFGHRGRRV
jgi:NADPH-dependent glutamate synthase beta subunit-like oxidoreductase